MWRPIRFCRKWARWVFHGPGVFFHGGIDMLKKAVFGAGALIALLNCGCAWGGGLGGGWLRGADVAMQLADVLRTYGIV